MNWAYQWSQADCTSDTVPNAEVMSPHLQAYRSHSFFFFFFFEGSDTLRALSVTADKAFPLPVAASEDGTPCSVSWLAFLAPGHVVFCLFLQEYVLFASI